MAHSEKRPERPPRMAPPSGDPPSAAQGDARSRGARMLAAADRAIEHALSGNSEAFLRATRQQGGE